MLRTVRPFSAMLGAVMIALLVVTGCGRSDDVASLQPGVAEPARDSSTPNETVDRPGGEAAVEPVTAPDEESAGRPQQQPTEPIPPPTAPPASPTATVVPPTPTMVPPTPTPAPIRVTVPAGSLVTVEFLERLSSHDSSVGQGFTARVVDPVRVDGRVAIPAGAIVTGTVTEAKPAKKVGGSSRLGLEFDELELPGGGSEPIAATFSSKGKSSTGRDVAIIAGAAAGGAILGNQTIDKDGGTKGALIGAAAGAIAASQTRAKPVVIEAGTVTNLELSEPVVLLIPG